MDRENTDPKSPMQFVLVGGQRCGTGWIAQCLREHPALSMAKDESRFLIDHFEKGFDWWNTNYMKNVHPAILRGEKCAEYLTSEIALRRLANIYPSPKIIISVRNPIDRYNSARIMRNRIEYGEIDFNRIDDADFERGLFGKYCTTFLNSLSTENVLVVSYDEMIASPAAFIGRIYQFLNVDTDYKPKSLLLRTKPGAFENQHPLLARLAFLLLNRRSPFKRLYTFFYHALNKKNPTNSLNARLADLYKDDIKILKKLSDIDVSTWEI